MALMTVTITETLMGMPASVNTSDNTMDKPVMEPTMSLLGMRK